MNARTFDDSRWSDSELEAFIDGDLIPERADVLRMRLETDAALRTRVARLREADAVMRLAMTTARPPSTTAAGWPLRTVWMGLALAAAVIATGVTVFALRPAPNTHSPHDIAHVEPAPLPLPADLFRIVLAVQVPVKPKISEVPIVARMPTPEATPDNAELREFQRALARGEAESAKSSFLRLSGDDRRVALDAVGRAVRSAGAAESVLDALPATEQVALARAWAIDGTQRPVAFARLRSLVNDTDAGQAALVAVQELASRPELSGWIASYGLVAKPGI